MHHLPATNLQSVKTAITQNYINVSVLTLLIYELFSTLPDEARSIWRGKLNAVSLLFVLNRYFTLAYSILSFLLLFATSQPTCTTVTRLAESMTIFMFFIFAVFPAFRIYAIWQRGLTLALLVFFLLVVQAGTSSYLYSIVTPIVLTSPKTVCVLSEPRVDIITKVVIGSRTVTIFAEALVCALTLAKTLNLSREAKALNMQTTIASLLVRLGVLYFVVFLFLGIGQTVIQETTGIEYLTPYILGLNSVLMNRFLLNLRAIDYPEETELTERRSDLVFQRRRTSRPTTTQYVSTFVANFGEELEFHNSAEHEEVGSQRNKPSISV